MKHFVIAAIVAAPLLAFAGPKDKEVKAHMAKAAKAHKEGKFELALAELKAAYDLEPKPDLQYAIGQVYVKLGRCGEAREAYDKFVAVHQDANEAVQQALAACKDASPPAPEPAPPPPVPEEKPAPPPPPPVAPAQPPRAEPPRHEDSPFAQAPRETRSSRPWYTDKLGDVLVAGGLAAGVIGFIEYRSAVSTLDDAEAAGNLDKYKQLVSDAHSKRTYSVILMGGGGALLVAGMMRYVLHDRSTESHAVGIVPAHGGGVVTWGGQF